MNTDIAVCYLFEVLSDFVEESAKGREGGYLIAKLNEVRRGI